ncbi:glycoside hydrolase family 2 protein (plasmid) [Haloferacaceae archaeon DSL9]
MTGSESVRERDDSHRYSATLDGAWEFVTDPENVGRTERWYEPEASWPDRIRTVTIPWSWEEDEAYRDYTGTAWYRRRFDAESVQLDGRTAAIRFGAVDYETSVWLNGEHVGNNRGGYLPFEVDATDALADGENVLTVAVTDPEDLSEIPHGKQGDPWYTRVSGIWQSVALRVRPETRVRTARVTPDTETDTAIVNLDVRRGSQSKTPLEATISAVVNGETVARDRISLAEDSDGILRFDDPEYWSPENPALYDLEVALERDGETIDRYESYFGLRSFGYVDGTFLLNGEPLTMRGILDQGYYPETLYRPSDEDTFAREIDFAKDAGFNLIRKHIKPAHPDFLECADRKGILVWQEPANPMRYTERSRAEVRAQLFDTIERDYNRPSVVIWSLYNEEWGLGHHDADETLWTDEEKQRFLADLYREVRERDPTRLVCDNSGWAHVVTDINDFHRYFVSPDRATEWASDLDHICSYPRDNYATSAFDTADAPIVISELGTWGLCDVDALRDRYGGTPHWFDHDFLVQPLKTPARIDDRFEQTGLADLFDSYADLASSWQNREFASLKHLFAEMRTRDRIAGYVLTQLSDIEWEFNGLLDYHREPKTFVSEFAGINAPVAIFAIVDRRAVWTGQAVVVELAVVNDTRDSLTGDLEWSLAGTHHSTSVTVPANGVHRFETTVELPSESSSQVSSHTLSAAFETETERRETAEPITVVDRERETDSARIYAEGVFASRLAEEGFDVSHTLDDDIDLAFTTTVSSRVEQFATDGGNVVHIPDSTGEMISGGPFSYRDIPRTENWNVVASFLYQDSPLLDDLCSNRRIGWEFDRCYPFAVATNLNPSIDTVHVGYIEGWLANWSSPLVIRGYGQGTITAFTFPVGKAYGDHPVATLLCDRIIEWLTD